MIILADDITGAAEVAGAASARGHRVRLVCGGGNASLPKEAPEANIITVIATDMRSMTADEAIAETRRIAALLAPVGESAVGKSAIPSQTPPSPWEGRGGVVPQGLIIKTDSALRGHVVPILTTLIHTLGYQRAVYLPANPSKGRIIRDGIYFVEGIPIHETAFSYDPEFPAHTSCLKERFPEAQGSGIIMPDAESREDIIRVIEHYNTPHTLFAGAADLIDALLSGNYSLLVPCATHKCGDSSLFTFHSSLSTIFLCGSTQSKPPHIGIPITEMPLSVYNGSTDLEAWKREASDLYQKEGSLIITLPPVNVPSVHFSGVLAAVPVNVPVPAGESAIPSQTPPSPWEGRGGVLAHHLREMTAALIHHLVAIRMPQQLILEGGASAFAALRHLGWNKLEVVSQLAPGVILTKAPNGTFVILKPGSYPWGEALSFENFEPRMRRL